MSKTAKIKGFLRQYDLKNGLDIIQVSENLATNYLLLVERREPGFNARSVATMTAIMMTPTQTELGEWLAEHGEKTLSSQSSQTIKDTVLKHMNAGVFTEREALEMTFQKAAWHKLMRIYEDYCKWNEEGSVTKKTG